MSKKSLLYFFLFILILIFVFRDLILNISTNLLDWRDYPYVIWVISQSINHITNLDFANFFETNAFYPHKLSLMFSDILLPQALTLLPIFYIVKNIILSFNITFLITFILNFIAVFLFWKQIFKKEIIAFFGSLFFIFSPFFHMEISHFQMLTYWPFFFTLSLLFKNAEYKHKKNLIFIGLLISLQFLASVYLCVYLIFSIFIFYLLKLTSYKQLRIELVNILIVFLVFLVTSGVFINGYTNMKKAYNIKRDIKEYITYSANLSDYIFTRPINSLVHTSIIMQEWNRFDKNFMTHASFPGFLIFSLSIFGMFKIFKSKKLITVILELDQQRSFFVILIIIGFIFSLGPRLIFNGTYAHIPLPYDLVIKLIPIAEATRVPSRWSFLFFLGTIYFSLITLNKLTDKKFYKLIFVSIFIVFILEYIPLNVQSVKGSYINTDYQILKKNCSTEKKVLLELPLTHLDAYPNIMEGLQYITTAELSSVYTGCYLVNGYSGYDLPDIFILSGIFSGYIEKGDTKTFTEEIRRRQIDIVKFNQYYFIKEMKLPVYNFVNAIATESGVEKINKDLFSVHR